MDDTKWAVAWARFESLRANPPLRWNEGEVKNYHEILAALEQATGQDLSAFSVADTDLKANVTSWTRGSFRHPARVMMSRSRYCDERQMRQQMEGVVMFFQNPQPPARPKSFGY